MDIDESEGAAKPKMKCTGRQFMPNSLQGIWLEARCSRDALPEKRVCEVCEFSALLGVIDEDVPDWVHMWGNKGVSDVGITDANMKIILTSSNIAHMFTDGIGLQNAPVESVRMREVKRRVVIKRKKDLASINDFKDAIISSIELGAQVPPFEGGGFKSGQETLTRVQQVTEMPGKKKESTATEKTKAVAKKKPIPLEFETATVLKSHASCIGIHYVEDSMDTIEVAEVIYKRVKKEVVDFNGSDMICYNDNGTYYQCGTNGEIKGIIEIETN